MGDSQLERAIYPMTRLRAAAIEAEHKLVETVGMVALVDGALVSPGFHSHEGTKVPEPLFVARPRLQLRSASYSSITACIIALM